MKAVPVPIQRVADCERRVHITVGSWLPPNCSAPPPFIPYAPRRTLRCFALPHACGEHPGFSLATLCLGHRTCLSRSRRQLENHGPRREARIPPRGSVVQRRHQCPAVDRQTLLHPQICSDDTQNRCGWRWPPNAPPDQHRRQLSSS
jgi:hypothetical protein